MDAPTTLDSFEDYHAKSLRPKLLRPSIKEVSITLLTALVVTPIFSILVLMLPLMGQVTGAFATFITLYYLYVRRSVIITLTALVGVVGFVITTFLTIQAIKNHVQLPILVALAFGMPVVAIYCMLVASRIWVLKGGKL